MLYCMCRKGIRCSSLQSEYTSRNTKKERKKFVRLKKKRHIKGVRKYSPLAQWLERAPYKSTIKVQFFYGLPYARLVKRSTHRPLKAASTGSSPVPSTNASVVELVDTLVSGTSGLCRAGSNPAGCTIFFIGNSAFLNFLKKYYLYY